MTTPSIYQQQIQIALSRITQNDRPEAERIFLNLLNTLPDDPETQALFASLCLSLNKFSNAIVHYQKATTLKPEQATYWGALGNIYLRVRELEQAEKSLQQAILLSPHTPSFLNDLGAVYILSNRYIQAIPILQEALTLAPANANTLANLAKAFCETGNYNEAISCAQKYIEQNPNNPYLHHLIGRCHIEMGDPKLAISHFEKALAVNPSFSMAYHDLSTAKKFSSVDSDPFIQQGENILQQEISDVERILVLFALGKVNDDASNWNTAYHYYQQANALKKQAVAHTPPPYELLETARYLFTPESFQTTHPCSTASTLPVFIVGMPRSGSTLIEQILAQHSQTASVGESIKFAELLDQAIAGNNLQQLKSRLFAPFADKQFCALTEQYVNFLAESGLNKLRCVDKQLFNFQHLGIIVLLFPNSKIVHTMRHPLDTCISCYFQSFKHINWACDFQWIGEYYRFYRKMMEYWQLIIPPHKILHVSYESVISNAEAEARNIIQHLGVEWEPACLSFYSEKRTVKTASLWQVRQPIYTSSHARWKHYAGYLLPLAEQISEYIDGADMEFIKQAARNNQPTAWKKFKAFFHQTT